MRGRYKTNNIDTWSVYDPHLKGRFGRKQGAFHDLSWHLVFWANMQHSQTTSTVPVGDPSGWPMPHPKENHGKQRRLAEVLPDWMHFSTHNTHLQHKHTIHLYIYIYYIALLPIVAIESIQSGWVDHVWRVNLGKYSIITWIVGIGQPNIMRSLRYVVIQLMPSIRFTSGSWDHARAINLF